jgi:cell volume regulation protein A
LTAGVLFGIGGRWLLHRARPSAAGLLPVASIALALAIYGATTLVHGSGFLATYTAGVVLGNGDLPYRTGILRVHDAAAWLGQVVMFLVLGLLTAPSHLVAVAPIGLALGLVLAFVARPLAVALCLLPFRFHAREILFIGWVGLRGAVPIILAILPMLAGTPDAARIFNIVFFTVVVNALVPGATVRFMTRLLRVEVQAPPPPAAVLEIASTLPLHGDVHAFYLRASAAAAGARVDELPLPAGAAIVLILRADDPVVPRGEAVLAAGDYVFVFCRPAERGDVALLFGRESD